MEELQECPFQQGTIPNQRVVRDNGSHESILFPMVLLPPASNEGKMSLPCFLETIRSNRERIENQLKEVGALLFRGFPLKTASDFNEMMEALRWEEHSYMGAAARKRVHGRVFTSSESALHLPIHFHHEMSKFENFPAKLLFFCEVAPPEGGQSAIVMSHKITQRMEQEFPELVAKLAKEGLLYSSVHPEKDEDDPNFLLKSWKALFRTDDKEEAES